MKIKFIYSSIIFLLIKVFYSLTLVDKNLGSPQSVQDNSVLILRLIRKNGKYLVEASIGTPGQNVTLMIDIASSKSLLYARRVDGVSNLEEIAFNKSLSESYSTSKASKENSKIEKFYHANENHKRLNGIVSSENFSLLAHPNSPNSNKKIEILNYEFLLNEDNLSDLDSNGIFSLSRVKNIKSTQGEDISLLKKISLYYKTNESFILINPEESGGESYMAFGDLSKIVDDPLLGNLSKLNSSSCDLIENNFYLSQLWSCSLSKISLNIKEKLQNNLTFKTSNTYLIFDTSINNLLIPEDAKIVIESDDKPVLLIEYILNKLGSKCQIKEIDENIEKSPIKYRYIQCTENPKEFESITLTINDHDNNITNLFIEKEQLEADNSNQTLYNLDILFYKTTEKENGDTENSFWILGNNFLNSFNAVAFDEEKKKIIFYSIKNPLPMHELEESLFSFFVLSLLCVVILIIIVFLVPYILYRRRRKAMMEKLQYEIIYKKMSDITREYGK